MARTEDEALYGGAAGGGKSDALVIEALRQVDIPHYRALILRKTYPQLSGADRQDHAVLQACVSQSEVQRLNHCWTFPSGAKIYFGSLNHAQDRYNYQGKAYDFIGFDELTHFTWEEYSYLLSRNRPNGPDTRVYTRATANPGGIGHGWVKARFISPAPAGHADGTAGEGKSAGKERRSPGGGPASLSQAPCLTTRPCWKNDPGYLGTLAALPEAEKKALLYGDWDSFTGQVFTEWNNDPAHYEDQRWTHVIEPFPIPDTGRSGADTTSVTRSRFPWGGMQRTKTGGSTASGSFTAAPAHPTRA